MLNKRQAEAYAMAMEGQDIFLTGGAGTGKSYLVQKIIEGFTRTGKSVIVCAPTAAAAQLIKGTTIHRAFGFPIGPAITKKGDPIVRCPKTLCNTDVILVDEISMVRRDLFGAIIKSVEKAEKKEGKHIQLILSGDFCQLPPVLQAEDKKVLSLIYGDAGAYAFQAEAWKTRRIKTVELTESVRAADQGYVEALSLIRQGDKRGIHFFNENTARELHFGALNLFGRNDDVDLYNSKALAQIDGPVETFLPVSSNPADIQHGLDVKIGARVVMTSNYSPAFAEYAEPASGWRMREPFINGSMGTVCDIFRDPSNPFNDYLIVHIDKGPLVYVGRKIVRLYGYAPTIHGIVKHQIGEIAQIPVRLGYAMTIHRAQGMTLDKVNIDPECFAPGQLYVALSRVSRADDIYLLSPIKDDALLVDPAVLNFYKLKARAAKREPDILYIKKKEEKQEKKEYAERDKKGSVEKNTGTDVKKPKGRPRIYAHGSVTMRIPKVLSAISGLNGFENGSILSVAEELERMEGRTSDLLRRQPADTIVIRVPVDAAESFRRITKAVCPKKGYINMKKLDFFRKEMESNGTNSQL